MLATMCPDIVFARLPVILTCGIVTALLGFILIKIEFHSHPLSVGSHAKKGIGYPMRVLISIVPSYTTGNCPVQIKSLKSHFPYPETCAVAGEGGTVRC